MSSATRSSPLASPPHVIYVALVVALVIGGTAYSYLHGSHLYNVALSAPSPIGSAAASIASARLPNTLFADRRNFLNRILIKRAWGWTTLAWLAQAFALRATPTDERPASEAGKKNDDGSAKKDGATTELSSPSPFVKSFFRFAAATLAWHLAPLPPFEHLRDETAWLFEPPVREELTVSPSTSFVCLNTVLFTTWFFGPSLSDWILYYTGAQCVPESSILSRPGFQIPNGRVDASMCFAHKPLRPKTHPHLFNTATLLAAEANGGTFKAYFRGGHDVSGHTFILVLSSLLLLEEVSPYLPYLFGPPLRSLTETIWPRSTWASRDPFVGLWGNYDGHRPTEAQSAQTLRARINYAVLISIVALVATELFCLLNTALFFHTPFEKFTGMCTGLLAWAVLPRGL